MLENQHFSYILNIRNLVSQYISNSRAMLLAYILSFLVKALRIHNLVDCASICKRSISGLSCSMNINPVF